MPFQTPAQAGEPILLASVPFVNTTGATFISNGVGEQILGPFFMPQASYKFSLQIGTVATPEPNYAYFQFQWYADQALQFQIDQQTWQIAPACGAPDYSNYLLKGPCEAPYLLIKYATYQLTSFAQMRGGYALFSVNVPYTRHDGRQLPGYFRRPFSSLYFTLPPTGNPLIGTLNQQLSFTDGNMLCEFAVTIAAAGGGSKVYLLPLYVGDVIISYQATTNGAEWAINDYCTGQAPGSGVVTPQIASGVATAEFSSAQQAAMPRSQCTMSFTSATGPCTITGSIAIMEYAG